MNFLKDLRAKAEAATPGLTPRQVNQCLLGAINQHGPINKNNYGSAGKQIYGEFCKSARANTKTILRLLDLVDALIENYRIEGDSDYFKLDDLLKRLEE